MANSNFYANIGVNAGFTRSRSNTSSHTEGAAVTTLKPMNENSSITYNNVNSITYQGTQAQGGTFIYNDVANIQKEAVELHNSYTSSSSSRGINAGATIGYGHKIQTTGNGGSISASQSNQNTVETVYANGNFKNVNEVHNNTGSMVLNGFNQEGGKVTGNIGKVEVISRQNTSATTGSSSGISLGISANGVPSSVNINGSRTNGNRAFVDNQSTFIVGDGSSLHVGTLENTGAVVGKQGNSTFKIDSYIGKDIQNHDTMKTTGGSLGISTGKPRITNVGFNQDSRDKQGITRNTVAGDVEIGETSGSPINRDLGKANEVTRDTHSSTNINVESQTIEYATNPAKLKEDIGKAKEEIRDVVNVVRNTINNQGVDKRGFMEELSTQRRATTINNLIGTNLNQLQKDFKNGKINEEEFKNGLEVLVESVGKDMGIEIDLVYTDNKNIPEDSKNVEGVARLENGKLVAYINMDKITSTSQLIGTVFEEVTHLMDAVAGKQKETTEEEKLQGEYGLESLGKPVNDFFREQYKVNNTEFMSTGDGIDYSKIEGKKIGNSLIGPDIKNVPEYKTIKKEYGNNVGKLKKDYNLTEEKVKQLNRDFDNVSHILSGILDTTVGIVSGSLPGKLAKLFGGAVSFLDFAGGFKKTSDYDVNEIYYKAATLIEHNRTEVSKSLHYVNRSLYSEVMNFSTGKIDQNKLKKYNEKRPKNMKITETYLKNIYKKYQEYEKTKNPNAYFYPKSLKFK